MKRIIEETINTEVDVTLPYYAVSCDVLFFYVISESYCIMVSANRGYESIGWVAPESALTTKCSPITKEIFEREFEIVSTIIKNKVYAR